MPEREGASYARFIANALDESGLLDAHYTALPEDLFADNLPEAGSLTADIPLQPQEAVTMAPHKARTGFAELDTQIGGGLKTGITEIYGTNPDLGVTPVLAGIARQSLIDGRDVVIVGPGGGLPLEVVLALKDLGEDRLSRCVYIAQNNPEAKTGDLGLKLEDLPEVVKLFKDSVILVDTFDSLPMRAEETRTGVRADRDIPTDEVVYSITKDKKAKNVALPKPGLRKPLTVTQPEHYDTYALEATSALNELNIVALTQNNVVVLGAQTRDRRVVAPSGTLTNRWESKPPQLAVLDHVAREIIGVRASITNNSSAYQGIFGSLESGWGRGFDPAIHSLNNLPKRPLEYSFRFSVHYHQHEQQSLEIAKQKQKPRVIHGRNIKSSFNDALILGEDPRKSRRRTA